MDNHAVDAPASAPTHRDIAVSGLVISVPHRYAEGHVLNAAEAHTLNQTFAENVSNNFRAAIKKALEAAKAEKVETLDPEIIAKLKADGEAYAHQYEFSLSGRGARVIIDPVEREANKLATELVRTKLKAKGIDLKALPEGKLEELVEQALAAKPEIREAARRRVEERSKLADLAL